MRPDARLDMHRFEGRKQILADEYAIKILPALGSKRLGRGVVIHDGDVAHAGEQWEAVECFSPKLSVRLVELRPDGQRLQGPLLRQMTHERFETMSGPLSFGVWGS